MTNSKAYFEAVATQWDEMREGFFSEEVREAAYRTAGVVAGQYAADIGAGTGFMTQGLLARKLTVIAVDQSDAMLAQLRHKFSGIECRRGAADRLPVADSAVDHVFANMYLHHVDEPAVAVAEMARILRPGGRLVITDLDSHAFEFLKTEHHDRWLGFARPDVKAWMTAAALEDVKVADAGQNCCADSCESAAKAAVSIFIASGTKPD